MVRTKAEMRLRASEAATLPVGVAIQATSGIVEGDLGRFRENRDAGIILGWIHDVPSWGDPPGQFVRISKEKTYEICIS
jgi:hypothetical protein